MAKSYKMRFLSARWLLAAIATIGVLAFTMPELVVNTVSHKMSRLLDR